MALRMMSAAMVPAAAPSTLAAAAAATDGCGGGSEEQPAAETAAVEREKAELAERLLAAAKNCHKRFGGKAELATEAEPCVRELCSVLERALQHGLTGARELGEGAGGALGVQAALRQCVSELVRLGGSAERQQQQQQQQQQAAFWECVREQLTWHERERFEVLRKVRSERGRGRAWLRAALNERSLENHLHSLLGCEPLLRAHYRPWAFLLDQDRSALLTSVAQGLSSILFAVRVDNHELDVLKTTAAADPALAAAAAAAACCEPIINAELPTAPSDLVLAKPRKKVHSHVIEFDDEIAAEQPNALSPRNRLALSSASCPAAATDLGASSPPSKDHPPEEAAAAATSTTAEAAHWPNKESIEPRLLTPLGSSDTEAALASLMPVSPALDSALDDLWLSSSSSSLPAAAAANYSQETSRLLLHEAPATETAVEAVEPYAAAASSSSSSDDLHDTALDAAALQLRLLALNEIAEQAREEAIASKLQLGRLQRQYQNNLDKHELQIQALNRENELLRQQLRKYVTAVQLLEKKEDLPMDYHKESQEYQYKLVQVAEMHAELMEFNARLTMQLNEKDRLVKLLQEELECLRGPINEEDAPTKAPFFIHIWIPSAFLTGQTSDVHHVYQIYIRIRDTEWNIYRRYAQFYALHRELKKRDSVVTSFEFPPKKTIGNKDSRFVEDRRRRLQHWLRRIVNRLSHCSTAFSSNPSKQTLVTLLPFFGDLPPNGELKRNNSSGNTHASLSPQYMGL